MMSAKEVAQKTSINIRTLKRWKSKGIHRRYGSGRKSVDPEMERSLCEWLSEMKIINRKISKKEILEKARSLSNS
jgi:hypothetical protein